MSVQRDFEAALVYNTKGPKRGKKPEVSNAQKLAFYGLYKQIQHGKCTTKAPSRMNVVAKSKWNAWNKLGNLSREKAMVRYVKLVETIEPNFRALVDVPSKV